jgi:hypothetical protein
MSELGWSQVERIVTRRAGARTPSS